MAQLGIFNVGQADAIAAGATLGGVAMTASVTAMAKNTSVIAFVFSSPTVGGNNNTVTSIAVNGAQLDLVGVKTNGEGTHKLSVYSGINMDTSAGMCIVNFATSVNAEVVLRGFSGMVLGDGLVSGVIWDRGDGTKTTGKRQQVMVTPLDTTRKFEATALLCKNTAASNASAGNGGTTTTGVLFLTDIEFYVADAAPGIVSGVPEGDWRNISSSSWVSFSCYLNGEPPEEGGSEEYFQEREKMLERKKEEEERAAPVAAPVQAPVAAPTPPPNPTGFESPQQVMDFIRSKTA